MTKSQKFPIFKRFKHFSKLLTNIVKWNIENLKMGPKGKNVLSSSFSEEFIAIFQVKMSQIDTENDKKPKVLQFLSIYAFLLKFK